MTLKIFNVFFSKIAKNPVGGVPNSVTAGAVSGRNEIIEWVDKVQSFEVHTTFATGAPYDGRLGYVNQEVAWAVSPTEGQAADFDPSGQE